MKPTEHEFNHAIKHMMSHEPNGTYWFKVGETNDGKTIAIVLGWSYDYEKGETYQQVIGDDVCTLVGKVAVNTDDLQCDYDWDWDMPSDNGYICDTDHALDSNSYAYLMGESASIVEDLRLGILKI